MSTREQTRRELKDLAKLAEAMTDTSPATSVWSQPWTERSSSVPPSAPSRASGTSRKSRGAVPPAVDSAPTPHAFSRSPRSFFPPATAGAVPAASAAAILARARISPRGALMAGATLAAAMVGGLLLGQALSPHGGAASTKARASGTAAATSESPRVATGVVLPVAVQPSGPSPAAAATAALPIGFDEPAAAGAPSAIVVASASPAPLTVRAPRPVHHAEVRPAPKPADVVPPANAIAAKASPVTKTPASHPAPAGHDSLDELIRKAASN